MLTINFNPSILRAQNSLNIAGNSLNTSLQRLTTGMKINSAKDDAAGYYVASGLNNQIRGLKVTQSNISLGSSFLNTAENALGNINDILNRLNDLALQGASSSMSETTRNALIKETDALINSMKNINNNTTFNGINVFKNADTVGVSAFSTPPPKLRNRRYS